jgi:tRNA A-37 threonylcarbamoyl transferase component Bud32
VNPRDPNPSRLWRLADEADRCPLLDDITALPEAVMARGRVLKHDGTTTVVVVGDGERGWVIKRYNTKNRWHAVRRAFRTSRAINCWRAASWLTKAGVDTPRPVAVLEERRLGIIRARSYFLCERVAGETLDQALGRPGIHRSTLIDRAADVVARLRQNGIAHGDLKATNFIVSEDRLCLVDLDATRRLSGRALETGLRKDLHRFMKNWDNHPELKAAFESRLADPDGRNR